MERVQPNWMVNATKAKSNPKDNLKDDPKDRSQTNGKTTNGNLGAISCVERSQKNNNDKPQKTIADLINEYQTILMSMGFELTGTIEETFSDAPNRCKAIDSKKTDKPCWYYLKTTSDAVFGSYGDWRTGESGSYSGFTNDSPSKEQIAHAQIVMREQIERSKKEKQELQEAAIRYVQQKSATLNRLKSHAYLTNKGIVDILGVSNLLAFPLSVDIEREIGMEDPSDMVIPMYNKKGTLVNWQRITSDGNKYFKKSAPKKGAFNVISTFAASPYVVYCEGYATGASIHLATGATVVVAFDAGNLLPVMWETKDLVQGKKVFIGADNDISKTGEKYADKCLEAFPDTIKVMPPVWGKKSMDLNDYHVANGLNELNSLFIKAGMSAAHKEQSEPWVEHDYRHEIDDELYRFPSQKMNDVVDWFKHSGVTTSHVGAMLGTIGLVSAVAGRSYREVAMKNYSAIYGLLIAPTGAGKDFIKSGIKDVLQQDGELAKILGVSTFTSEAALRSHLMIHPNRISIMDEFGNKLDRGKGNASSTDKQVFETLKELYSDVRSSTLGRAYSQPNGKAVEHDVRSESIINPHLTIIGMSTPSQFANSLSYGDIEGGLLNRFLVIDAEFEPSQDNMDFEPEAPDWLVEHCKLVANQAGRLDAMGDLAEAGHHYANKPNVTNVMVASGVKELWYNARIAFIKKYSSDDMLLNLAVRWVENSVRICVGMAAFEDPKNPTITMKFAKWALSFVQAHGIRMAQMMDRHTAKDHHGMMLNQMLELIRKKGHKGLNRHEIGNIRPFKGMLAKERDKYIDSLLQDNKIKINMHDHIDYGHGTVYYAIKSKVPKI